MNLVVPEWHTPAVAAEVGVTERQLRHWVRIGLLVPVADRRVGRTLYAWELPDVRWAAAVAELVRAGANVTTLGEWASQGRMSLGLDDLASAAKAAGSVVPTYVDC